MTFWPPQPFRAARLARWPAVPSETVRQVTPWPNRLPDSQEPATMMARLVLMLALVTLPATNYTPAQPWCTFVHRLDAGGTGLIVGLTQMP